MVSAPIASQQRIVDSPVYHWIRIPGARLLVRWGGDGGANSRDMRREPAPQRLHTGDRLGNQAVGAGGRDALAVLAHGVGGQRHDRHLRPRVTARADRADHIKARQPRHLDVDHHQVNPLRLEPLQRLDAVGADDDLGFERAQHLRRDHLVRRIVLGQQYAEAGEVVDGKCSGQPAFRPQRTREGAAPPRRHRRAGCRWWSPRPCGRRGCGRSQAQGPDPPCRKAPRRLWR